MKNFNPKALLTVICNKLKDFLKLTFEFYKYRCRKKITNKDFTCVQDRFRYFI